MNCIVLFLRICSEQPSFIGKGGYKDTMFMSWFCMGFTVSVLVTLMQSGVV